MAQGWHSIDNDLKLESDPGITTNRANADIQPVKDDQDSADRVGQSFGIFAHVRKRSIRPSESALEKLVGRDFKILLERGNHGSALS